ncbi:uncharacterized protein LOC110462697 [Mizuhopecten yessoensis]|uniref:uncharacterized protein LOC110462697 n=1 Tax=Mizuhopecten yessoensis TaxID=6573 RepID=UPI000B45BB6F|nr:uncharacterized protein LOC110462697 [Mizuhopecten yessoensis]
MNNVDRGLVTMLTLSIIIAGFVLENKLLLMHHDHLSMHSSTPEPSSSTYKDSARLQRVEKAINVILTQRNCPSYVNLTNVADALVGKLSGLFDTTSVRTICDVPNDKIPIFNEELDDSKNQDDDSSETLNDWTVIPWLCWIAVWIYRLALAFVLGLCVFCGLPETFEQKDGKGFCQITVFIVVSSVGYFPNVLMDVCGSYCTAWYFPLCIGLSRLLWIMSVCFVNTGFDKIGIKIVAYVVVSIVSIIVMYNGFHPMMIMT